MPSRLRDEGEPAAIAASLSDGIALLEELAKAGRGDFDDLKRRAALCTADLAEKRRATRESRGRLRDRGRAVDEWILDIFRSTESALPRETLMHDFLSRYRRERKIVDLERHAGPWLFVFEAVVSATEATAVQAVSGAGVHPQAFRQICADLLPQAHEDPFLSTVMFEQRDIDGWHATWFQGSAIFDRLIDIKRRFDGESDYWVNATWLPGDARHNGQGLFALHPNVGDLLSPEPPSSMRQDQRLMMALSLAWRQLEHQVQALAALTEQDRRELLNLIAPGLLHHELGSTLRTMYGQAYELFHILKHRHESHAEPGLSEAVRYSHNIGTLALRAYTITDVFNNLDKRAALEVTDLGKTMADLLTLLHHRFGTAATELIWDRKSLAAETVETDVVLLQQALINILINAMNAMVEATTPSPRRIEVVVCDSQADAVGLEISNNGPPVPTELARDIFRRGYTTRREGHGQGLYLVRLIAHYLGGEVALMEPASLPPGQSAGFRIHWSRRLSAQEGLARVFAE